MSAFVEKGRVRLGYRMTIILFLAPAVIFLVAFLVYPIFMTHYYALFEWHGLTTARIFVGLGNFIELVQDPIAQRSLTNNIAVLASAVFGSLPLAFFLALLLSRTNIRFRGLYRTSYFLPSILPIVVVGLIWSWFYNPQWGLFNQLLKAVGLKEWTQPWLGSSTALPAVLVVTVWQRMGYYIVIYLSALASIPSDIYDAMKIDGANLWQETWGVLIPMLRPTITVTVAMAIIGSIRYFDVVWVMTVGGPNHATELLATYMFKLGFFSYRMGYASAIAVVLFLLALVLTVTQIRLMEREIVQY
jgi:raffinose/stachyose/melibiose transport system permease protein